MPYLIDGGGGSSQNTGGSWLDTLVRNAVNLVKKVVNLAVQHVVQNNPDLFPNQSSGSSGGSSSGSSSSSSGSSSGGASANTAQSAARLRAEEEARELERQRQRRLEAQRAEQKRQEKLKQKELGRDLSQQSRSEGYDTLDIPLRGGQPISANIRGSVSGNRLAQDTLLAKRHGEIPPHLSGESAMRRFGIYGWDEQADKSTQIISSILEGTPTERSTLLAFMGEASDGYLDSRWYSMTIDELLREAISLPGLRRGTTYDPAYGRFRFINLASFINNPSVLEKTKVNQLYTGPQTWWNSQMSNTGFESNLSLSEAFSYIHDLLGINNSPGFADLRSTAAQEREDSANRVATGMQQFGTALGALTLLGLFAPAGTTVAIGLDFLGKLGTAFTISGLLIEQDDGSDMEEDAEQFRGEVGEYFFSGLFNKVAGGIASFNDLAEIYNALRPPLQNEPWRPVFGPSHHLMSEVPQTVEALNTKILELEVAIDDAKYMAAQLNIAGNLIINGNESPIIEGIGTSGFSTQDYFDYSDAYKNLAALYEAELVQTHILLFEISNN